MILAAALEDDKLRYLVHEGQEYRREDGSLVLSGPLDLLSRFALRGESTFIARGSRVITLEQGAVIDRLMVDCVGTRPVFASNTRHRYWVQGGRLLRSADRSLVASLAAAPRSCPSARCSRGRRGSG